MWSVVTKLKVVINMDNLAQGCSLAGLVSEKLACLVAILIKCMPRFQFNNCSAFEVEAKSNSVCRQSRCR